MSIESDPEAVAVKIAAIQRVLDSLKPQKQIVVTGEESAIKGDLVTIYGSYTSDQPLERNNEPFKNDHH